MPLPDNEPATLPQPDSAGRGKRHSPGITDLAACDGDMPGRDVDRGAVEGGTADRQRRAAILDGQGIQVESGGDVQRQRVGAGAFEDDIVAGDGNPRWGPVARPVPVAASRV